MNTLRHSLLGQQTIYPSSYNPNLLFPIPRMEKRAELGIGTALPFQGQDIWNSYEMSWLNDQGKPIVAFAEFHFPCESTHLIESKSFKLYLNSYNQSCFHSFEAVESTLVRDLSKAAGGIVTVKLLPLKHAAPPVLAHFSGTCLDDLEITCDTYTPQPHYLTTAEQHITETVYSDLLKSNCPVTGQPDWGSVQLIYTGRKINHAGLLQYIVSYRNHDEFHEQCVERIFTDVMRYCAPEKLCVYARYTRRGGLDINPYRANYAVVVDNNRLIRQ